MSENTLKLIADSEARWVDLRFTDPRGKEQHVTFPAHAVDSEFFAEGNVRWFIDRWLEEH
jgi:glutamine synthetase